MSYTETNTMTSVHFINIGWLNNNSQEHMSFLGFSYHNDMRVIQLQVCFISFIFRLPKLQ